MDWTVVELVDFSWWEEHTQRSWVKELFSVEGGLLQLLQNSVKVSELDEDVKGLFIKFVGNTNCGRITALLENWKRSQ